MTNEEAIRYLKLDIDMMKFDPSTGEKAYLNEDVKKTIEAMEMAIEALEPAEMPDETADEPTMSVAKRISGLALINIQDIFQFTISAKDDAIIERYGSEERAVDVAEKYMDIAMKAQAMEFQFKGWSMKYSMPLKDSDERVEYTARFYDVKRDEE